MRNMTMASAVQPPIRTLKNTPREVFIWGDWSKNRKDASFTKGTGEGEERDEWSVEDDMVEGNRYAKQPAI
jgi:hypothetical protein